MLWAILMLLATGAVLELCHRAHEWLTRPDARRTKPLSERETAIDFGRRQR